MVGTSLRDGRYAICGVLGGGGQGATFDAVDKVGGHPVAIKRFEVSGARSWKDVQLAEREARVLSELSHELLPAAFEHFEEDGSLYLVMEKIEGKSMAQLGALPPAEVFHFLEDAAQVLAYLHGRVPPVIHRDIKPSNVICRPARSDRGESRAHYVVVDFGSVRDSLKPAGGSTVVGTFGFMAPEQFQGRAMPQSDVYGVGATAITVVTGQPPEDLPHRGLAINVKAAFKAANVRDPSLRRLLIRLLDPNPDKRAAAIAPLLQQAGPAPEEGPPSSDRGRRRPRRDRDDSDRPPRPQTGQAKVHAPALRLPWLITLVATMGLLIARIGITLSLRVAVPIVLTMLSLVFGRALRRAAKRVTHAGKRAGDTLKRAQGKVRAHSLPGTWEHDAEKKPGRRRRRRKHRKHPAASGMRVNAGGKDKRVRIENEDADLSEQLEQAVEEAAEAVDEVFGGRRRR
jgi:hypothetical protein